MEDGEHSGGTFNGTYNKLISQEDFNADDNPLYSHQEKQHVSMSIVRPESSLNPYKVLTGGLVVLAVILLSVDIGLGVYYRTLSGGHQTVMDISREVAKLQATYNAAVQSRDEAKKQLAKEMIEQQLTKWELEHQSKRAKYYEQESDKIQSEIAALKSHVLMIKEGCRHCLPSWTFLNSACYYVPFSDDISRKSWQEARDMCRKKGADLAVTDTREKHLAVSNLINNYQVTLRQTNQIGYWIGLRDEEEEGTWRWLDGTRLTEGYWHDGEPNNLGDEDCAVVYPRRNPFQSWNDAPCAYGQKWICEMTPRPVG